MTPTIYLRLRAVVWMNYWIGDIGGGDKIAHLNAIKIGVKQTLFFMGVFTVSRLLLPAQDHGQAISYL